ncbi:hypothetical protein niasHT_010764 [Heterodera trifolii]|uniref:Uncharacterized protein n=1 Tax=Heterodera trifolii TaxID=157864 RepID=A0ABD2KVJ7_9BILA
MPTTAIPVTTTQNILEDVNYLARLLHANATSLFQQAIGQMNSNLANSWYNGLIGAASPFVGAVANANQTINSPNGILSNSSTTGTFALPNSAAISANQNNVTSVRSNDSFNLNTLPIFKNGTNSLGNANGTNITEIGRGKR